MKDMIRVSIKVRILCLSLAFVLMLSLLPLSTYAENTTKFTFSGGEGTVENPYLIKTKEDLLEFEKAQAEPNYGTAVYQLVNDIDLGTTVWKPIGADGPMFQGVFDGNGKKITIRKMEKGTMMGFFAGLDRKSTIKDLTLNSQINMDLSSPEPVLFGLLVGRGEGKIYNCIVEGSIVLTNSGKGETYVGSIAGRASGSVERIWNKASLTLTRKGEARTYLGGLLGEMMGNDAILKDVTNQGTIVTSLEGSSVVGGVIGMGGFGAKIENLLNSGNVTVKQTLSTRDAFSNLGGIIGELRDADLNKALNKGNLIFENVAAFVNDEIIAAGVAGMSERAVLSNVGNEGNIETKTGTYQHAIGITKPGREVSIKNAYTKGRIYASTNSRNGDVYVMGIGEKVSATNFYVSGSMRLKVGTMAEVNGDAIANVRPGDSTSTYNYGYWLSQYDPFPGYPTFNKATATTKSFNVTTGKLSTASLINGKSYIDVSGALNAWVASQSGSYLTWKVANEPTFDWNFGYVMPEYMKYTNAVEGKWLSTSNWALPWLQKADEMTLIPNILLNQDMTKGITRKEFSALAVVLYEHLTDQKVPTQANAPFKDVNDAYVNKAYALGIVSGVGNDLFSPNAILSREQASTMLTRVYKAAYWEGWTLENDSVYVLKTLDISGVEKFSDDHLISSYAKESVYFMMKNEVLMGIGNNTFAPSTTLGTSETYGKATREQAFKIAVSMMERFKK